MTKVVLNDVTNLNSLTVINENFDKIETALQDKVLFRDNPVGEPNALITDLDANGKRIYNLPEPILESQAARLKDVQNAIAGASQANLIGFTPYSTIEATNVQAAIQEIVDEISGGGGGGYVDPTLGGATFANFTMDEFTSDGRVVFANTVPAGWNNKPGRMTVDFELVANNYFVANPNGHVAIVLRCDTDVIATAVKGTGAIFGALAGTLNAPDYNRSGLLETWANGIMPNDNYLFKDSWSSRNKLLEDGQRYRFIIESTRTQSGVYYVRYRIYAYENVTEAWKLNVDTGDVLDHNRWADFTKSGLAFGHVFPSNLVTWSINFSNIKVTWGPAQEAGADLSAKANKFGADVDGDLTFVGNSRRIRINNTGTSFPTWTAFQSQDSNDDTTVLAIPSGTAVNAGFLAANASNPTSARCVGIAMNGNTAYLEAFGIGGAPQPNLDIRLNVGGSSLVTFDVGQQTLRGNLTLGGDGRRIFVKNDGGYNTWGGIQSSTTNGSTSVLSIPNGTNTNAEFIASNASGMTTFGAIRMGMNTALANIETLGIGGASNPELAIKIGIGNEVVRFTSTGLKIANSNKNVGSNITNFGSTVGMGGSNCLGWSQGSNINYDLTYGPTGAISSGLEAISPGAFTAAQKTAIEYALRPVACHLSTLMYELWERRLLTFTNND